MPNNLTLHLLQWRVVPGDIHANLAMADELIGSASPGKGDLVLMPELFSSGFYYPGLADMAGAQEEVFRWMGATASRSGIGIAGSIPTQQPEGVANTMILMDRTETVIASYDKIHLFFAADEDIHFVPGQNSVVAQWEGVDVGLAICFDLRFPEMTRELCDKGARIVLVSAQWPRSRVDHFRDFARVRAMENQMYVASCNSCGDDGKGLFLGGGSNVVGPAGDVKGILGDGEGVLTVSIDLNEVRRVRSGFPVLKVRRRDLFNS